MTDELNPAPAWPSSTVVLLRDGERRPEILMVRRRPGDAFGDSYAFPGGVLDDDENLAHDYSLGRTPREANVLLDVPTDAISYYSAAIRELFEETGVLLARNQRQEWAIRTDAETNARLLRMRQQIDCGTMRWSNFLREQELMMACDSLHYFAHWETPKFRPKRWSTRFFIAKLPTGQHAQHDGTELTDSRWVTATDALSEGMELPFPTTRTLKTLSRFSSINESLAWADEMAAVGVKKVRPVRITVNGKQRIVIPGDPDYPVDAH